jgi:hypothetical protein
MAAPFDPDPAQDEKTCRLRRLIACVNVDLKSETFTARQGRAAQREAHDAIRA